MLAGNVAVGLEIGGLNAFVGGWGAATVAFTRAVSGMVKAAVGIVQETAKAGDQVQKMSQRTGWAAQSLSEMGFALEQSGTSMEAFETSLRGMSRMLREAEDGSKTSAQALARIGLSIRDLRGLDPEAQFERIAKGIQSIEDPTRRAGAAMELFGRSGTQMLPLLSSNMEGLRKEASRLGLAFNKAEADASALFQDEMNRAQKALLGIARDIGKALLPVVTPLLTIVANLAVMFRNWAANTDFLGKVIRWVTEALRTMAEVVEYLVPIFAKFFGWVARQSAKAWLSAMDATAKGVQMMARLTIESQGAALAAISRLSDEAAEWARSKLDGLGFVFKTAALNADILFQSIKGGLEQQMSEGIDTLETSLKGLPQAIRDLVAEAAQLPPWLKDIKVGFEGVADTAGKSLSKMRQYVESFVRTGVDRVKSFGTAFASSFKSVIAEGGKMGDALQIASKKAVGAMASDEGEYNFQSGLAMMFTPGMRSAGLKRMVAGLALMALGARLGAGGGAPSGGGGGGGDAPDPSPAATVDAAKDDPRKQAQIMVIGGQGDKLEVGYRLVEILNELGPDYDVQIKLGALATA